MKTIYNTCPSAAEPTERGYGRRITEEARWSEAAGCHGMLIFTDNTMLDPWAAAQFIVAHTERLVPLVAVNPVYAHPFTVARLINTMRLLYKRRVDLNLVSGGFGRHLREVGDGLDHDQRYARLAECGQVISRLLTTTGPVHYSGASYQLDGAALIPPFTQALAPRIFVSGSSDASRRVQEKLGVTRLSYPDDPASYTDPMALAGLGIRIGIIARDSSDDAWHIAHERFPLDLEGEELHDFAAEQVSSQWHLSLSSAAARSSDPVGSYWLYPYRSYKTYCPYLVGSHAEVAKILTHYAQLGVDTMILDQTADPEDLGHAMAAIARVSLEDLR